MVRHDSFEPSELILIKQARASTLLIPGTFVRFASGGPIGIITSVDSADNTEVTWFANERLSRTHPEICLIPVSNAFDAPRRGEADASA